MASRQALHEQQRARMTIDQPLTKACAAGHIPPATFPTSAPRIRRLIPLSPAHALLRALRAALASADARRAISLSPSSAIVRAWQALPGLQRPMKTHWHGIAKGRTLHTVPSTMQEPPLTAVTNISKTQTGVVRLVPTQSGRSTFRAACPKPDVRRQELGGRNDPAAIPRTD